MTYTILAAIAFFGPAIDVASHRFPKRANAAYGRERNGHYFLQTEILAATRSRQFDYFIVPALFASLFARLALLAIMGKHLNSVWVWFASAIVAAATMRGLQEISHYALHGSLVPGRRIGLTMSDILAQAVLIKPHIHQRVETHVTLHHPNVNDETTDPNIQDYVRLGFRPPMRMLQFLHLIIYPLSPHGIYASLRERFSVVRRNQPLRLLPAVAVVCLIGLLGGFTSVCFVYLLPLIVIYPWLAWISQLVEHRWFEPHEHSRRGEYRSGRAINLKGLSRFFVEWLVLPFGDSFHLAHSLYPAVRWNYLSSIHRILMEADPDYFAVRNYGLFFSSDQGPSVFVDLKHALVGSFDDEARTTL